jgi:hypothetical protein
MLFSLQISKVNPELLADSKPQDSELGKQARLERPSTGLAG